MRGADYQILTVNPGSTSTKIGIYVNDKAEFIKNLTPFLCGNDARMR